MIHTLDEKDRGQHIHAGCSSNLRFDPFLEPCLVRQRFEKWTVTFPFSPKLIEGGAISLLEFSLE